jgi:hypothetical protein
MEKGRPTKIQDLTKLFMKLSDQARKNKEKNDKEFDNTAVVRPIENDSQYGGQRKLLDRERIGKDARASLSVYEDKDEKKNDDSVQRAMNKDIVIINPDLDPDSKDSVVKGKKKDKKNMSESYADIVKRVVLGESRSQMKRLQADVKNKVPGAQKKLSNLMKQMKADGGQEYAKKGMGSAGKKLAAKKAAAPKVEPKPSAVDAKKDETEQTELQKYNKAKLQKVVMPLVGTEHVPNRARADFLSHVTNNAEHIRNKAKEHDHWKNGDPEKAIQTVALSHYKDATSDDAQSKKNIARAAAAISAVRK